MLATTVITVETWVGCIVLQQGVMAWSLSNKAWMKKVSRVCKWDLVVVLAC